MFRSCEKSVLGPPLTLMDIVALRGTLKAKQS